jgi:hypothetical protein
MDQCKAKIAFGDDWGGTTLVRSGASWNGDMRGSTGKAAQSLTERKR